MSDFMEYPKAIYSVAGKFAVVPTKDAEEAQWIEWGETAPDDADELPNPLAVKVDQEPVAEPIAAEEIPAAETPAEPAPEAPEEAK
jgi:hypothetical protein